VLQPIIVVVLLGIVIVSFTGIGVTQADSWNNFDVWVQQYGWTEADIVPPVSNFSIELIQETAPNDNDTPTNPADDFDETFVKGCIFSSTENMPEGTGLSPGKVICKLLNENGDAIAEGREFFFSYTANDPINILSFDRISVESLKLDNIFDVTAVVEAPI